MVSWWKEKKLILTGLAACILVVWTVLVYANSFSGVLLLDDQPGIELNPQIQQGSLADILLSSPRPLLQLSFALNYRLGGTRVFGYHLFNLVVHVLAGLLLFGLICRTFRSPLLRQYSTVRALLVAFFSALFWLIHPLQTESVTYIFQRSEALMGMFYLLTLFSASYFFDSRRQGKIWAGVAVVACFLGMGCKPVMVTAPLMVLLYDRVFWTRNWRDLVRRRKFYWALFSSWILLVMLVSNPQESLGSVGWGVAGMSPGKYALNQPAVILHYLRLIFWPHPLILDYSWEPARNALALLPAINVLLVLLALVAWAWKRYPAFGFLGCWFSLILSPSSGFIPLADLAFEHRLYLPLAGIVLLLVVAGEASLRRMFPDKNERIVQGLIIVVGIAVVLSYLTVQRNASFRDPVALWAEVVRLHPDNARATYNLGLAYFGKGNRPEALKYYLQSVSLRPDYFKAHNNLGNLFYEKGDKATAARYYRAALELNPLYFEAHNNYGVVLMEAGNFPEAKWHLEEALRLNPRFPDTWRNLGNLHYLSGEKSAAKKYYLRVLDYQPGNLYVRGILGEIYWSEGNWEEARRQFAEIVLFQPDNPAAHNNLGGVLLKQGDVKAAIVHFQEALRLAPDYAGARQNLQSVLADRPEFRRGAGLSEKGDEPHSFLRKGLNRYVP